MTRASDPKPPADLPAGDEGMNPKTVQQVVDGPEGDPSETGYCWNADCPQVAVPLWRPVAEVPVLCQCGQLLHDQAADDSDAPEPAEVEA